MFNWLTNRTKSNNQSADSTQLAEQLYAAIVAQARRPFFYSKLGIADTIPGRFEMVSLHMFIMLDRLGNPGEKNDEIAQQLVDVMFMDMDDVARETGVGDMGVGPRIKKLARSFQSRLEYYKASIEGDEDGNFPRGVLSDAISEIHFKGDKAQNANAKAMADYVVASQTRVGGLSLEEMLAADQLFADLGE